MKLEKIKAGVCDTGLNQNCDLNSAGHSSKTPSKQRLIPPLPSPETRYGKHADQFGNRDVIYPPTLQEWCQSLIPEFFEAVHPVSGDIGPVEVFGNGGPRVIVGFRANDTSIWVERCPQTWTDSYEIFGGENHRGRAVARANKLATFIRKAAFAEVALREKMKLVRRCNRTKALENGL